MKIETTNYGLAGGKLDATQHVARAIDRLTSGDDRLRAIDQLAVLLNPKRMNAENN